MKKVLLLAALMLAASSSWCQKAQRYDFSATAPSGQTLYYKIDYNHVYVTYPNSSGSNLCYQGYTRPTGNLVIPDSVTHNGITYSVEEIGSCAFLTCNGLTSVTFPEKEITIGSCAFDGCYNLTSVIFPQYQSFSINHSAFRGCGFDTINITKGCYNISTHAFINCPNLTTIIYNAANCYVSSIGIFDNCPISSITIGDSVWRIPGDLFSSCPYFHVTSLVIPQSVTYIGERAFSRISFDSLTLPGYFSDDYLYQGLQLQPGSISGFVRYFATDSVTLSVSENDTSMGYAFLDFWVGDYYGPESSFWLSLGRDAVNNSGYHFAYWDDFEGDEDWKLHGGHFTAYFESDTMTQFVITTNSNNTMMGSVSGGGTYGNGDTILLTAIANDGYHFTRWQDGVTANPRTVTVSHTYTYTAFFEPNAPTQYTLTVTSANTTMGSVSGGGIYNEGATATLTATANSGYHFAQWQDGNTQNPRTVTVTGNATYTAYFEADGGDDGCPTITSFPWNNTFDEDLTCWKTVDADGDGYNWGYYDGVAYSESYSYFDGTQQGLTPDNWLISRQIQVPASGNYKLSWRAQGANNNYFNEHYSVYLSTTGDNPSNFTTQLYSETLNTANAVSRSVSLQDYHGQTIRVAFRHHNTNDVFVLLLADVKVASTQGIDDVEIANNLMIYAEDGHIHVTSDGQPVDEFHVYDVVGREVYHADHVGETPALPGGVYLVKVGNLPAKKVVVIR